MRISTPGKFAVVRASTAAAELPLSRARSLAVGAVIALLALYGIHAQLPQSALRLPGAGQELRAQAPRVFPQGWAFFTKSPRDPSFQIHRLDETGDVVMASLTPHSSPHNAFGFDRQSRTQGTEYALLLAEFPLDAWRDCPTTEVEACADPSLPARPVVNGVPSPTLCGDLFVIALEPQPWAWRDLVDDTHRAERVLRIDVECPA
ncbi:SdpA family antimicrobial peptide system protein [Streptomyces radicis]|uniref:SdpA family antimicrobial peptide system protein n=1 Tax=Streptomyces radicis TaxID=1750517 RepID=UPI001E4B520D|nr:SdpA family antimicrobial peptide system protein [Streptomyces radicis]